MWETIPCLNRLVYSDSEESGFTNRKVMGDWWISIIHTLVNNKFNLLSVIESEIECAVTEEGPYDNVLEDKPEECPFEIIQQETVVELLGVVGRRPWLRIVVCCSSRDELDAYSDLAERERSVVLEKFRQATINWNQPQNSLVEENLDESETGKETQLSHLVVVTDVCLPLFSSGESPLSARVLINYELPTKKETYTRRITTCIASGGIVINMVVGSEVTTLKNLEESSSIIIAEMPINISEVL